VTVEWLTCPAEIGSVSAEWSDLEASVRQRTHLSASDFLIPWYQHYAGDYGGTPLVGLARDRGRLVGVAPLTITRGRIGGVPVRRVEFAPSDVPAGEFLVDDDHPETVAALLDSLVRSAKFDVISLDGFEPESPKLQALTRFASSNGLPMELCEHAFAIADLSDGYQTYRARLSGHYRRNLNHKAHKIEAAGPIIDGVQFSRGVEAMDNAIERMITITEASYKLQGARLADSHRGFLADVVKRFGRRGLLSLTILSIRGEDAAFLMGVVERGCFFDITLAYAEPFEKLSPGAYLMHKTMEALSGSGVHTVVSHGAHEYKRHWATAFVPQKRVFLFASGPRGVAARLSRFTLAPVWRRFGVDPAGSHSTTG
jgi:CelD/BcsL family acetyltransferase involved in cellulose biosynthesis